MESSKEDKSATLTPSASDPLSFRRCRQGRVVSVNIPNRISCSPLKPEFFVRAMSNGIDDDLGTVTGSGVYLTRPKNKGSFDNPEGSNADFKPPMVVRIASSGLDGRCHIYSRSTSSSHQQDTYICLAKPLVPTPSRRYQFTSSLSSKDASEVNQRHPSRISISWLSPMYRQMTVSSFISSRDIKSSIIVFLASISPAH